MLMDKWRSDRMTIVKQQGMEVLDVDLSPSVSLLWTILFVRRQSRLNACPTLSWKDNLFRPRSLVALFESGISYNVAHAGGREVCGDTV
jgi:hypothetical protein